MSKIKFYMAGSGDWRTWFPGERSYALYEALYPVGARFAGLETADQKQISEWEKPGFTRRESELVVPQVPIFTDSDNLELSGWFAQNTERARQIIVDRSAEYRSLATVLSDDGRVPEDHLFTILICGHTLDVGTLDRLQAGILGDPPKRGESGSYFIWGETATRDLTHFYGVNSYGILRAFTLSVMWSPGIKRAIPNQRSMTIPVFGPSTMEKIRTLCTTTAEELAKVFSESVNELKGVLNNCSFRLCPLNDILCMLFHIGYGLITDALVRSHTLPEFPRTADDSWGIWIHSQ